MPFSFRQFVRQTPSPTLKTFFDSRGIDFGDEVDWSKDDVIIARQVGNALEHLPAEHAAPLISDFERAQTLSDERGYCALINAAPDPAAVLALFESAENNQQRALLLLLQEPDIFSVPRTYGSSTTGSRGTTAADFGVVQGHRSVGMRRAWIASGAT